MLTDIRELLSDPALSPIRPLRVVATVCTVCFVVEGSLMLLLPLMPTWYDNFYLASLIDATAVSAAAAPALWFMVVRPVRRMFEVRGQVLQKLLDLHERERDRVGRDLHDELGQHLTALMVGLRTIESADVPEATRVHAGQLRELAARGLAEVRRLARDLRSSVLQDLGLVAAVERLCEDFENVHGAKLTLTIDLADARLSPGLEQTAYRVLQEIFTNIARHADASAVDVELLADNGELVLVVADNGRGFPPHLLDEVGRSAASFGLASIHERVRLLAGSISIETGVGRGVRVTIRLPITQENRRAT